MNLNEVLQWAVIAVVALISFASARQSAIALPRSHDAGPRVGTSIPTALRRRLAPLTSTLDLDELNVAFITENCRACQQLIVAARDRPDVILVARTPSAEFVEQVEVAGLKVVRDEDGSIWRAMVVSATPLVIRMSKDGRIRAKGVTYDVSSLAA